MKTKKELIIELKKTRPDLHISVHKKYDDDYECDDLQSYNELIAEGLEPYVFEVRVTTIRDGELLSGNDYLSGSWQNPNNFCQEIHGYFEQMMHKAIEELDSILMKTK